MKTKRNLIFGAFVVVAISVYLTIRATSVWGSFQNPETEKLLKRFIVLKEAQANAAIPAMPPEVRVLFKYAKRGEWLALSNSVAKLKELGRRGVYGGLGGYALPSFADAKAAVGDFVDDVRTKMGGEMDDGSRQQAYLRIQGTPWEAAQEICGAFASLVTADEKYSMLFGREIIDSIPAGSIYLSSTDPARFIVTAMCPSQPAGDPFFTISQKELLDEFYCGYLSRMYGRDIYTLTEADSQKCMKGYIIERKAQRERLEFDGITALMDLAGIMVKMIFDKNPGHEFYIEDNVSCPDWMYSRLEPHGLIFKINRQPVEKLSDEIIRRDHDFWTSQIRPMIGGWLKDETSLPEIAVFAKKTFVRRDFNGFGGDLRFINSVGAQSMFSKSRSAIAAFYVWRTQNATDVAEQKSLIQAADFAFRQAWALCPSSPPAVSHYINFLLTQNRFKDAMVVAQTAADLTATKDEYGFSSLPAQMRQWHQEQLSHSPH